MWLDFFPQKNTVKLHMLGSSCKNYSKVEVLLGEKSLVQDYNFCHIFIFMSSSPLPIQAFIKFLSKVIYSWDFKL